MNSDDSKGMRFVTHEPVTPHDVSRRDFLRLAAAGGGLAVTGHAFPAVNHQGHGSSYGTMMFEEGHSMPPGQIIEPPGAPAPGEVEYRVFDMDVQLVNHEILPGVKCPMFAFNGVVPGPEFHVTEGDWIQVNFTNRTEEMHTIHWHGVTVPYTMDGVPMMTQDPLHPGDTFVYRFQARPAGTRWYHCHFGTPLHASHGMHGAFIIHRKDDPLRRRFPYTRDYTQVLEAWDIHFAREEINGLLEGMKQVNLLMRQGKLGAMTHGFFRNYEEFVKAVQEQSYIPAYMPGRSSGVPVSYNFFGINGKCFPAIPHLSIKRGEWIRVRFINAGNVTHHMHLHGHDFWWVAQDGNDLPEPRRLNTVHVEPGGTYDILIQGDNPGYWAFHDHNVLQNRNNGIYPGGIHTMLMYEDFEPTYTPSLSVDE